MVKKFNEAFPDFKMDGELGGLLNSVDVYRITSSRDKKILSVFIKSRYLIGKKDIRLIESNLSKSLFPDGNITIRFFESFNLSEQYDARALFDAYKESLEYELKEYNPLLERVFHKCEPEFLEDNQVELTIEDTIVTRSKSDELIGILEKVFNERCGVPTSFTFNYVEAKKSQAMELAEERVRREAQAITERIYGSAASENGIAPEDDVMLGSTAAGDVLPELGGAGASKSGASGSGAADGSKSGASKAAGSGLRSGGFGSKKGSKVSFERRSSYKSDNPDVILGRDFDDEPMEISSIEGDGEVTIHGKIIFYEEREIRNEKTIIMFHVTDFDDTITVKYFAKNENLKELRAGIKKGAFVKIKGVAALDRYDHELSIGSLYGMKKIPDFTVSRMDNNPMKRVELHCHSKMSEMDGVSDVKDIVLRAKSWGHSAIAITDHGVVQAFTDANHALKHGDPFKIIYGVEGYLVDDKQIVENSKGQTLLDTYVVFDIETTGLSPVKDKIIEIGAVKIENGEIVDRFSEFVNPQRPIPFRVTDLTSIDDSMVKDAPVLDEVLPRFFEFSKGAVWVAHNASFDVSFMRENGKRMGLWEERTVVDTVGLSRFILKDLSKFKLDNVAKALKVSLEHHHRAVVDAEATAEIFIKLCNRMEKDGITDLDTLSEVSRGSADIIRKSPPYHVIILAKNETGRVNLYKLISESHLKYFNRAPRIPKRLLNEYREGLIIGSACEAGELFRAILDEAPDDEIARIVSFYDYLEIQPIGNNEFLYREGRVDSREALRDFNRKIVKLGEQFNKPVCATCDVHFLDPEDEVYRRIIMAGKGFKDADDQAPLYLRTTDEMLEEFSYLGAEKAWEVVVTNTNMIADSVDKIPPVRPDKAAPVIDKSDETLREICNKKAKEIYGEELPEPVKKRMDRELDSIINNGFAVMYIIAQKLVWKSNEDGYLVGSRGSVGSSFVAFLAGITEVNSLSPHYYCSHCHYNDFDSDEVKQFAGMAGCDMPDKVCPVCGEKLNKDGFDIPFETFLGFKGDKEPDIDLNFSGDYQSKAHKYTEVIFGAGCTFKAGTVGTLAEKTAYGYVKKYYEERGIHKRGCEIDRISVGCTGVRRTTGQHPGGIIVLPHGEEIYTFTPVQHPANDVTTDIVTTHFDYHSIDHNLLKLDILGHDDPTMIKFLQDMTGVDPRSIPLDDKGVMSLFQNTDALKIQPEDIGGTKLGALGIPEFGTDFAMQMLIDTKPQYFSDLVRIAGLSHGTDVWLGNAETLIKEGKATISTAICTRDDIMIYLIQKGVDPARSFKIMENVRKGKVAKGIEEWPEWKQDMIDHDVPDWYIWSCEKIKYMFPKAHAAAYVMMAWRIAWFKIYYPLAYYAAFFSIRATGFSYELMCMGKEKLEYHMAEYRKRGDDLAPKEQDQLKDMRLVQEMYARGLDFMPIDLDRVDARYFQIIDGKLMPSLSSIDGVGDNAAASIVEAVKAGEFLSKDDFRERSGVSKTIADQLSDLGLLGKIPESNQLSLFDL